MQFHRPLPDVTVLADQLEVPGVGHLPVNAFVLHAAEPVVVDTGLGLPDRNFLTDLASVLDPADVRWIWLTHLPPAVAQTERLCDTLQLAPQADPFVGPDQRAPEEMLASFEPVPVG